MSRYGRSGWPAVGLMIGLVAATAVAASLATLELVEIPREDQRGEQLRLPPPDLPAPLPERASPAGAAEQVAIVAVIVGLLAAALLIWRISRRLGWWGRGRQWFRLRRLPAPALAAGPHGEVLAAVARAAAMLDDADDLDPRRAVIGCWVRLTEAAEAAGVPSHPSDTATDLVLRLLRRHRISEPVLAELAATYRLARYAAHPVDGQMRAAARAALGRLHVELRGASGDQAGVPRVGQVPR